MRPLALPAVAVALLLSCSGGGAGSRRGAASSSFPHQPAGFTVWTEWAVDALSGNGWDATGDVTVAADAAAPLSPPNVGQWRYPSGFAGGSAPGNLYHALPPSFQEGFVGVWWKPSAPWQGHSSQVNKIFFLLGGACGNLVPVMYGPPGGPYELRVAPEWGGDWAWLTPNAAAAPVALGAWHRLELYFKYNTAGRADGLIRWWLDGALVGDHRAVTFPAPGCFTEFQLSPTWGGVGDVKTRTDHFWFDHVLVSQPSATAGVTSPSRVLFQEGFEDDGLASRGWYDDTAPLLSSTERTQGARSIEYTFPAGATTPTTGSPLRRKFPPSESVYLGYSVKYSANWVGSERPYHPHELHFLTNQDDDWSGLSFTRLTAYVEQNGGVPLLALQDGQNVDQSRIGRDLTAVTENRAVAGCNGSSDGHPDHCYTAGGVHVNEKKWRSPVRVFGEAPGPFYKADWHRVEVYLRLNTVAGGKGLSDGVLQYWADGRPLIDRKDVLLRTGARAAMRFSQLVIAPYIGDGSPVAQSLWIDDVTVATARP